MAWGHDTTVKDTESLLPKWWEQSLNTRDDEAGLPEEDITSYVDPKTFDLNISRNAEIAQNNTIVIGNEHYDKRDMSEGGDKTPHNFYAKGYRVQTARDVIARTVGKRAYDKDFDYERGKFAEKLLGPMPMYDLDKQFPGKGKFDKRRGVNPRGSALTNYDAQRHITNVGHRPLTAEGMIKQVIFDELGINPGGQWSAKHGLINPRVADEDSGGLPVTDITPSDKPYWADQYPDLTEADRANLEVDERTEKSVEVSPVVMRNRIDLLKDENKKLALDIDENFAIAPQVVRYWMAKANILNEDGLVPNDLEEFLRTISDYSPEQIETVIRFMGHFSYKNEDTGEWVKGDPWVMGQLRIIADNIRELETRTTQ